MIDQAPAVRSIAFRSGHDDKQPDVVPDCHDAHTCFSDGLRPALAHLASSCGLLRDRRGTIGLCCASGPFRIWVETLGHTASLCRFSPLLVFPHGVLACPRSCNDTSRPCMRFTGQRPKRKSLRRRLATRRNRAHGLKALNIHREQRPNHTTSEAHELREHPPKALQPCHCCTRHIWSCLDRRLRPPRASDGLLEARSRGRTVGAVGFCNSGHRLSSFLLRQTTISNCVHHRGISAGRLLVPGRALTFLRANGPTHTSLGRRPRYRPTNTPKG